MSLRQLARFSTVFKSSLISACLNSNILKKSFLCNQNVLFTRGLHALPNLPFDPHFGLEPAMSIKTVRLVYADFLKHWVESLNKMIDGTNFATMSLIDTIDVASQNLETRILYNTASQVWNCNFCLSSLSVEPRRSDALYMQIETYFGSYEKFVKELHTQADTLFGGGFIWLVKSEASGFKVIVTPNAESPIYPFLPTQPSKDQIPTDSDLTPNKDNVTNSAKPIFGINLWGYSYILDHGLDKHAYIDAVLSKVDWTVVYDRVIRESPPPQNIFKNF